MKTPYPGLPEGKLAYIRQVDPQVLPGEVRARIPQGAAVWGIHNPEGECIALTDNRAGAFALARDNDFAPVSVH